MSQLTITKCDQCGAIKGETNHWFFSFLKSGSVHIYDKKPIHTDQNLRDLCSEKCVIKEVSQFISPPQQSAPDHQSDQTRPDPPAYEESRPRLSKNSEVLDREV